MSVNGFYTSKQYQFQKLISTSSKWSSANNKELFMSTLSFFLYFSSLLILMSCGGGSTTSSSGGASGGFSGGVLDPIGMSFALSEEGDSLTWSWRCPANLPEGHTCQFRYAITPASEESYEFDDNDAYRDPSTGDGEEVIFHEDHDFYSGDGRYRIHIQYRVLNPLEEDEDDRVVSTADVRTYPAVTVDFRIPQLTGLENATAVVQSQTWSWGCSESNCTYRYYVEPNILPDANAHTFSDADPFGSVTSYTTTTTQGNAWSGFVGIHVQARDTAGRVSSVVTVRAELDNMAPSVTELSNDGTTKRMKTWNWSCDDIPCTYLHIINQSSSHTFSLSETFNSTTTATQNNVTGTYYLHVQAKDEAGNKSSVKTVSAILQEGPPEVTGLSNDSTAKWEGIWDWDCDGPPCTFRHVINTSSSPPNPMRGAWSSTSRAVRGIPDGTYYIHVQARNNHGEGTVATYSAVVDFDLSDLSLQVHGTANPRNTNYSWSCSDCTYRYSSGARGAAYNPFSSAVTSSSAADPSDLDHFVNLQARKPDGTRTPVVHVASYPLKRIDVGGSFTCALESGGTVKCWGQNDLAQSRGILPSGSKANQLYPGTIFHVVSDYTVNGAVEITTGWKHACALFSNGGAACWGQNNSGQLGAGDTDSWQNGRNVSSLSNAMTIDAGSEHTCAVLRTGVIKCWGQNDEGQLGDNSKTDRHTPVSVSGISNAIKVSGGDRHTCALLDNGKIKCWGRGDYGRLGNDSSSDSKVPVDVSLGSNERAIDVSAGSDHSCAVLDNGTVKCWGGGGYGQLGDGNKGNHDTPNSVSGGMTNVVSVSAGLHHTCALRKTGGVVCWGANDQGELGRNSYTEATTPVYTAGTHSISSTGQEVVAGFHHTCALLTSGEALCWGENNNGRLGNGSTSGSNPNSPVKVKASSNSVANFGTDWDNVICSQIGSNTSWHCMSE